MKGNCENPRESEYDRGTGCGKTARPDLCGGLLVTGVPTARCQKKYGDFSMNHVFPEPIKNLPEADIPLAGVTAHLSQSDTHQILFMEFETDVDLPEHSHEAQIGIVLEGKIDLVIGGEKRCFTKGDRYYIPPGVKHSRKIYAGYADVTFFNESNRYSTKSRFA